MTAKEFVKNRFPKARAERQKLNRGGVYFLIRPENGAMYISTGTTESNAWANAKKHVQRLLNSKQGVEVSDTTMLN